MLIGLALTQAQQDAEREDRSENEDVVYRRQVLAAVLEETDPHEEEGDGEDEGELMMSFVSLAKTKGVSAVAGLVELNLMILTAPKYHPEIEQLGPSIGYPQLETLTRRFLYKQLNPNDNDPDSTPIQQCPEISSNVSVFHFANASYFAPSDPAGVNGVRRELIRATPQWAKGEEPGPRYNCVLVSTNKDEPGMFGMHVARVRLFFSFWYEGATYTCALVE
jgi:hypothetical protein